MLVYKISNDINNKVYIGITEQSLETRWNGHLLAAHQKTNRHLYNAMNKYGIEHFHIEIIDDNINSKQELLEKEIFYISKYRSANKDFGYNMTYGGDTNPMSCEITKQKHRKSMQSKETRSKISKSMKKYRSKHEFSDEHRKRLSESAMGNHNWGTGDTRSIPCYCILDSGEIYTFHNYRQAGKWWYETLKPFGDHYAECTFQRKIKSSIAGNDIKYKVGKEEYFVTNIKWYKGGDNNE